VRLHGSADPLQKGLKYLGTATDSPELIDTYYAAILSNTSEWGQITPGNSQKWDATEKFNGVFTFTNGAVIADLAATNSQLLRCHTLVWYSQLPLWVSGGTWTNETLLAVMKTHITSEVTHYKGQCYAWDVVNEALDEDGTFRTNVFYNTIGEDYIQFAFDTAAAADPDAKLYVRYSMFRIFPSRTSLSNFTSIIQTLTWSVIAVQRLQY
jgi:endo-1,4-beta-xylanase